MSFCLHTVHADYLTDRTKRWTANPGARHPACLSFHACVQTAIEHDGICFCRTSANVPSDGITQAWRRKHHTSCARLRLLRPQCIREAFQKVYWHNATEISTKLPVAIPFQSNLDFAKNEHGGQESNTQVLIPSQKKLYCKIVFWPNIPPIVQSDSNNETACLSWCTSRAYVHKPVERGTTGARQRELATGNCILHT